MKKLITFFSVIVLIALMFCALFLAGAIYDTNEKLTVVTYFFQTDDNFIQRQDTPVAPTSVSETKMRNDLIAKYITEYFHVTPDVANVENRMIAQSLGAMSTREVQQKWTTEVMPEIKAMAEQKMLRLASLVDVTKASDDSNYLRVEYELKTWEKPNDFSVAPVLTRGVMYMHIMFEPYLREQVRGKTIEEYLESGGDPAAVFRFGVYTIADQK
ncbi:MAG: hypothetical protein J6K82_01380 [Alphaproteobacteria bacterium]|nr:hypothetical protein [Alphaproteobacteria bacterium]